jgi:glycosyltransferase involved in cell wall biosynthesis
VVGSGTHFLSGISYYTYFLSTALADRYQVSVVLMRKLIPRRLYPGRARVGHRISDLSVAGAVPTFDGLDWYAVPSLWRAIRFLRRQAPEIVVFQWWTGSVILWYLLLQGTARRMGAAVVVELHEDLDTAELRVPVLPGLVRRGLRRLLQRSDAYVVHSAHDVERLADRLSLPAGRTWVIQHGPYPMAKGGAPVPAQAAAGGRADGDGEERRVNLLYFGTIRPYKGVEVLVDAFEQLAGSEPDRWELTVVGEVWEGWTLPLEKIAASAHRNLIDVTARYVADDALPGIFGRADVVVLPYLRSSASGPLQMAMSAGLPVVVSAVGGLVEAVGDYSGAVLAEPSDPDSLAGAIRMALTKRGTSHADPHSWEAVADRFGECFDSLRSAEPRERGGARTGT